MSLWVRKNVNRKKPMASSDTDRVTGEHCIYNQSHTITGTLYNVKHLNSITMKKQQLVIYSTFIYSFIYFCLLAELAGCV